MFIDNMEPNVEIQHDQGGNARSFEVTLMMSHVDQRGHDVVLKIRKI